MIKGMIKDLYNGKLADKIPAFEDTEGKQVSFVIR